MLISYVLREPRFMTPTAVTSPLTHPPSDERDKTESRPRKKITYNKEKTAIIL